MSKTDPIKIEIKSVSNVVMNLSTLSTLYILCRALEETDVCWDAINENVANERDFDEIVKLVSYIRKMIE